MGFRKLRVEYFYGGWLWLARAGFLNRSHGYPKTILSRLPYVRRPSTALWVNLGRVFVQHFFGTRETFELVNSAARCSTWSM